MNLSTLLIYSWLVMSSFLCVYWAFVIIFTKKWTQRILTAKLFKRPLEFEFGKDGSLTVSVTAKKEGIRFNEKKQPIQDFEEEYNKSTKETFIKPRYWSFDGVRILLRPEDGVTCLDNMFQPCEPSQTWLENYIQRQKLRIELGKKFIKRRAPQFPLLWIVLIILLFVVGYILYFIFW